MFTDSQWIEVSIEVMTVGLHIMPDEIFKCAEVVTERHRMTKTFCQFVCIQCQKKCPSENLLLYALCNLLVQVSFNKELQAKSVV